MDNARYKLVFEGETLPGFKEKDVRKNLKKLLNVDEQQLQQLFSKQPVVIRKNLSDSDIRPYEKAMAEAGAHCRILPVNDDEERAPESLTDVMAHDQPDTVGSARSTRKFQLLRRAGRVQFIASLWMIALLGVGACWLQKQLTFHLIPSVEPLYLALGLMALACPLLLMVTARRLHDINRSGWGAFLQIVPGINLLLTIWLIFSAGSQNSNRFGPAPGPTGIITRLLGLWMPLLVIIAFGAYGFLHPEALQQLASNLPDMIHR